MRSRLPGRGTAPVAVLAVLGILAFAATAAAVLTGSSGTSQVRMDNRGETAPSTTNSVIWVDLPGSPIAVNVATSSRLINARFTAESSRCVGPASGFCAVRIVATTPAGIIELDPASGMDFAFDTDVPGAVDADLSEAHAMERSRRLAQGNYVLRVQRAVTTNTTSFTLDDWHFAVETSG